MLDRFSVSQETKQTCMIFTSSRCMKDAFATRLIGGTKSNPAYDKLFNDTEGVLKECDDMDFIK